MVKFLFDETRRTGVARKQLRAGAEDYGEFDQAADFTQIARKVMDQFRRLAMTAAGCAGRGHHRDGAASGPRRRPTRSR